MHTRVARLNTIVSLSMFRHEHFQSSIDAGDSFERASLLEAQTSPCAKENKRFEPLHEI
jgi:hypothetical protein